MASNDTPPAVPDYTKAAEMTAASGKKAIDEQTVANRPDQTDIYGNTSSWSFDPATGKWSQKTALGGAGQAVQNQQDALRGGLMGQATDAMGKPLDTSGIQDFQTLDANGLPAGGDFSKLNAGQFTMDPIGNAKAIQDATYGLLTPQRTIQRNQEIQRLKNQGLTEGSPAWNAALTRLDQGDTDAQLKALLAGTTEYGNQFERAKGENQQNFNQNNTAQTMAETLRGNRFGERSDTANFANKLRDQQLTERTNLRGQPLKDLASLDAIGGPKTDFKTFANAGTAGGTDYMAPLANTYRDLIANNNATNASKDARTNGLIDIFGQVLGSGNSAGGTVGGDIWGSLKDYLSRIGG